MSGPFDEQQLAADLHRAAESYDPDGERIRMLMAERNTAPRPERRGWTVAWVAAAASVVLAVTGTEAVLSGWNRDEPSSGSAAAEGPAAPTSSTAEGVIGTATSVVRTPGPAVTPSPSGGPTGRPAVPVAPQPTGSPVPSAAAPVVTVTPRVPASTTAAGPGAASTRARPTGPGPGSATDKPVIGGRTVTVDVSAVAVGTRRTLGANGGQWTAFTPAGAGVTAVEGPASGWQIGPAQIMGSGANPGSGPFVLTWSKSAAGGAGSSSMWLTAPHDSNGAASGLRLPVRYGNGPASVTLLVGTIGGGGQLTLSGQDSSMRVDLPRCSGTAVCPAVVRIDLQPVSGGTASSSDLLVDLAATDPSGAVGFAAADLT